MSRFSMQTYRVPLKCRGCGHEWEEEIALPMQVDAFMIRVKGWGVCPKCGGEKVDMLFKPPNPFYRPEC